MRAGFLATIMLVVGLFLGIGVGYMIQPAPRTTTVYATSTGIILTTTTLTSSITKTETTTMMSTKTVTVTATPKPPSGCEIISASVVMRNNIAHLYVKFTTSVTAALKLIGPEGEKKSSDMVSPDETAVYLQMSSYGETPLPGKYKVIMESLYGKLTEKEFEFSGYKVKATKLEFDKKWYEYLGGSLYGVTVYLENDGDLPTYVTKAKLTINEQTETIDVFPESVPLGGSSIKISTMVYGLKAGSYNVKVTLINDKEDEIATIEGSFVFP